MADIDTIKSKIKKLLALSKSPNPNEAASALRMAQALMAEYKIGEGEINILDITDEPVPTAYRDNPPRYENDLINTISHAFGCKNLYHLRGGKCVWRFIGLRHRAQVAAFMGQVLLRKLKSARAEYIKTLYRVRSKYRKTERADDFCLSWVAAVAGKLTVFAGVSDEEKRAVKLYVDNSYQNLSDINAITRSAGNRIDYLKGAEAAAGVQLQHGVGTFAERQLIGAAAGHKNNPALQGELF